MTATQSDYLGLFNCLCRHWEYGVKLKKWDFFFLVASFSSIVTGRSPETAGGGSQLPQVAKKSPSNEDVTRVCVCVRV